MNVRYVAIVSIPDGAGEYQAVGGETVIEQDKTPVKTGLLDRHGTPVYRVEETVPMGFQLRKRL